MLIGCILRRKNNFRFKIHRRAAQRNGFFMAPHYIYGTSGLGVRRHKEPCTLCKLPGPALPQCRIRRYLMAELWIWKGISGRPIVQSGLAANGMPTRQGQGGFAAHSIKINYPQKTAWQERWGALATGAQDIQVSYESPAVN